MRSPQPRLLAAAVSAALAVGALSACSALSQKSFEDDAKVSQQVTSVRLDSSDGWVKLTATPGLRTASVHRKVNYRGDKPHGTSFRVKDGVLTLSGCGRNCGVDYDVKVPAGLPVSGGTSNGSVTLTGVGAIDVHTSNGEIAVTRPAGPVKLRTSNGNVRVTATAPGSGPIDARTSNGRLTIRTAAPQNVTAHTSNGSLTVTTPPASYRISATTSNGTKKLAYANTPSGMYRLDLSTTNGNLTVGRGA